MTYSTFLLVFVAVPAILLAAFAWKRGRTRRPERLALAGVSLLAFGSALPWDAVAIERGYWFFSAPRLLGPHLGWVPLEEASFFVLEALLVGVAFLNLASVPSRSSAPEATLDRP